MFVADSLFSLEFTVDKLTITPGVVCRFPTVAFRFLDFPTISLHFLDETQRDRLRAKLTIDPEYKVVCRGESSFVYPLSKCLITFVVDLHYSYALLV